MCHILAISVRFQWVLGSLNIFLSLYGIHTHIYMYIPKSLVTSVAIVFFEIDCNVNNAVSIKYNSRTKDFGPRTGYKSVLTKEDYGLRTTDCGLTACPTVHISCRACIYLCRMSTTETRVSQSQYLHAMSTAYMSMHDIYMIVHVGSLVDHD